MAVVSGVAPAPTPSGSSPERVRGDALYTERGRDLRIDFLRGLCVIAMIVDHVAGASWLYVLTGGNRFYTSAAEGFVFVSGLVAGRAYTRFIARDGLSYGLGRILGRAGQLYLLAVCLTLAFVPVSEIFHLPWALGWDLRQPVTFVVGVVTLHTTYYLVDVMLLYVLLLLASAVALVLCTRGQSMLILGGSWLLWLAFQVFPDQAATPWPIVGNNLFYFSAWQLLFFTGLVIGHNWEQSVRGAAEKRPPRLVQWFVNLAQADSIRPRALTVGAALLAVAIAFYSVQDRVLAFVFRASPDPALAQAELLTFVFGKSDLRFGRVLAFGLVFFVFFLAATQWWTLLKRGLGWLVLPLGQNALYAYSAHVVLAAGIGIAQHQFGMLDANSARQNTAIQVAAVLVAWVLVRLRIPKPLLSSRPFELGVPVLLAVAALVVLPRVAPEPAPQSPPTAASAESTNGSAASPSTDTSQPSTDKPTAAEVVARAYGTVIPAGAPEPKLPASVSSSPVPQPTVSPNEPAVSVAGHLQGTLLEPDFFSVALNTKERFYVYLPPGSQTSGQRYPTLYMLHGGGDRNEWVSYGLINAADQAIASGALPPMIIVLPQGDDSYWVNHVGGPRWGDYLAQDVVGHIDSTYPTIADARHRAIGGLSMGGWGALYQAFSHPDEFGVVGAHAPSLRSDDGSMSFLPRGDSFKQFDPVQLASNAPGITGLRVWIDADAQDPWAKRDADLHTRLDQRHVVNAWNVYPGQHGGSYWHDHVQDYLKFYGAAFSGA